MPGGNERKVLPGESLRIQASTMNDLLDMLRAHKRNKVGTGGLGDLDSIKPNSTIQVRNSTGSDLDTAFKVLRLSGVVGDVVERKHDYNKRPAMGGFTPDDSDNAICITQVPLTSSSSGKNIGKAVVSGVTLCRVHMTDLAHVWASPTTTVEYLTSGESGQARILWYGDSDIDGDAGADIYFAVVLLIGAKKPSASDITGGVEESIVVDLCPIYEDVTYTQAMEEMYDLLSHVPGFEEGKVLSAGAEGLEWATASIDPEDGLAGGDYPV